MASSPVVLILGAGSNVGQHVARAFAAKNYKVALVARKLKEEESTPNELHIPGDLSNPNTVVDAFAKVRAVFGHPSVVVYNGINPYSFFFLCK
jgi:NAD(P)-dependent dehydrogenase (short-subunit alcohol dehydrogenase family)